MHQSYTANLIKRAGLWLKESILTQGALGYPGFYPHENPIPPGRKIKL
jgi:hypothetical protein